MYVCLLIFIRFVITIYFSYYCRSLYRLQSVIVHIGEVNKGHFITYRRDTKADDWVLSSDECTKFVSKQSVLLSNAYLLFYEREDEQASS